MEDIIEAVTSIGAVFCGCVGFNFVFCKCNGFDFISYTIFGLQIVK
jgi:hypothetical protein